MPSVSLVISLIEIEAAQNPGSNPKDSLSDELSMQSESLDCYHLSLTHSAKGYTTRGQFMLSDSIPCIIGPFFGTMMPKVVV